jgi:hypothetical protein
MWSDRQILWLTLLVTAMVCGLTVLSTGDWMITAITIPLVASAAFWSLRLSRRIGQMLQRRYAPPPNASRPDVDDIPEQTSERPEHAQRRRHRRRQRGRREGSP